MSVVLLGLLETWYRHQGRLLEVCTEKSDTLEFLLKNLKDLIITLEGCVDFEVSSDGTVSASNRQCRYP